MSLCSSLCFFLASQCPERKTKNVDEDREEVFTVELQKGPHGLGLALVDGMVRKCSRDSILHLSTQSFPFCNTSQQSYSYTLLKIESYLACL